MKKPTIGNTEAVFQAGATIGTYLLQAIEEIDKYMGDGYAAKHPALLAECVRSQTLDYNSCSQIAVLYEIKEAMEGISSAIDGISSAIDGIPSAMEHIHLTNQ